MSYAKTRATKVKHENAPGTASGSSGVAASSTNHGRGHTRSDAEKAERAENRTAQANTSGKTAKHNAAAKEANASSGSGPAHAPAGSSRGGQWVKTGGSKKR
jgi:hypothetical protein